jgi:RNA-directed DNA polymerase
LHGLEDVAKTAYRRKDAGGTLVRPTLIRYADDFVVLCADKEGVLQAQKAIAEWLDGIGLRLHPSKTRVTHTLHLEGGQIGFDFLGFNIRQYPVGKTRTGTNRYGRPLGFKTLITPSKDAVKRHMTEVGKVVADHRGAPQAALIGRLNPLINGWCAYHRTVVAKRTFADCDNQLYAQLRSWAKFRHPSKPQKWIVRRYWSMHPGARWDFVWKRQGQIVYRLRDHAATPIKRHVKVKGTASPYDGNLVYWARRLAEHPLTSSETGKLLRRQAGKCARCGLYIREEDCYEIDHIIPRSCGGNDLLLNKQILHGHCHQRKTAEEAGGCR